MNVRENIPFIITIISLGLLISCGYALSRLTAGSSLFPFSSSNKTGTLFYVGDHKVGINQPFSLKIKMNTAGQSVNAAGLYMRFDPNKVQITEISTLNSFCQYYPEKKFDNKQGLLSLACGSPQGVKGENELIEIKVTPLSIGATTFFMDAKSQLLLNDGKGTNILSGHPNWEVQIVTRL